MGSVCGGERRERMTSLKQKGVENMQLLQRKATAKYEEAKVRYSSQLETARIKYDQAKLRVHGYEVPRADDRSPVGCVTRWELHALPLYKISIDDYERRLKKLVDKDSKDQISLPQVEECFKDHYAFKDLGVQGTLTHALFTDWVFKKEPQS